MLWKRGKEIAYIDCNPCLLDARSFVLLTRLVNATKKLVEKFEVKKSGVVMSSLYRVRGHFNPRLSTPDFSNHELFNPVVQKFTVDKSGVERSWG